jgi:DNA-binding SARP family transcriptional activator
MDLLQRARDLFAAGRMHDALEVAQAACDRAPKDPEAWWLLGRVSRHTGMPVASDEAFRRAARLSDRLAVPYRVSGDRFLALLEEARAALPEPARRRLEPTAIRAQPMPTAEQVRAGVDPDALTLRERAPEDVLVLFQVNHENHSGSEDALRALVARSLVRA